MHSCSEFVHGFCKKFAGKWCKFGNVAVTETQMLWDLWLMVLTFAPARLLTIFMCPTSVSHSPQLIPRGTFESIHSSRWGKHLIEVYHSALKPLTHKLEKVPSTREHRVQVRASCQPRVAFQIIPSLSKNMPIRPMWACE